MNILYILGNGFDINLGLETRYSNFYPFYLKQKTDNEKVVNLKKSINSNIKTWADLEVAFGLYTKQMTNISEFDELFSDIQDNLSKYLQGVESAFNFSKIDKQLFFSHFSFPEKFLVKRFENEINSFKNKWKGYQWNIDIITLNYTRTLEKVLQYQGKSMVLGTHDNTNIMLQKIFHIHGYTDSRMVLGVNDKSQIGNEKFRKEIDAIETLIKDNCNVAQGHTVEVSCKTKVKNANLICIFGSSLGKTDKLWWNLILKRLEQDDCRLIIFDIANDDFQLRPQIHRRIERDRINQFLNENNLILEKRKEIENKIYFAFNTNIFKVD